MYFYKIIENNTHTFNFCICKYLVWQNPYSLQQGAQSGHPSGQAILSGSDLNGGAGQLPAPSPAPVGIKY